MQLQVQGAENGQERGKRGVPVLRQGLVQTLASALRLPRYLADTLGASDVTKGQQKLCLPLISSRGQILRRILGVAESLFQAVAIGLRSLSHGHFSRYLAQSGIRAESAASLRLYPVGYTRSSFAWACEKVRECDDGGAMAKPRRPWIVTQHDALVQHED